MSGNATLIIENFGEFRQFVLSILEQRTEPQVIYQASDGLEGVQQAEELQPDLVLLDINLPRLNGIETARRIRTVSPNSKILFLTQECSPEAVEAALSLGAQGYVLKRNTNSELLLATQIVLKGKRFVGRNLEFYGTPKGTHHHEILFCSGDAQLLNGFTRFLATALKAGNGAIVWATDFHRDELFQRLQRQGVDVDAATQRGLYISSDISEPPDSQRMLAAIRGLSEAAFKMGNKNPRVAVCGERTGRLWTEGKTEAALRLEQLWNELADSLEVCIDILCSYPSPKSMEEDDLASLCAEHSSIYFR